jgi:hypothetical protein
MKVVNAKSSLHPTIVSKIKTLFPTAETRKKIYRFPTTFKANESKKLRQKFNRNVEIINLIKPTNKNRLNLFIRVINSFILRDKINFNFDVKKMSTLLPSLMRGESLIIYMFEYQDDIFFKNFFDNLCDLFYNLFIRKNLKTNSRGELVRCVNDDVYHWLILNRIVESPIYIEDYFDNYKLAIFNRSIESDLDLLNINSTLNKSNYSDLIYLSKFLYSRNVVFFTKGTEYNVVTKYDEEYRIINIDTMAVFKTCETFKEAVNWSIMKKHRIVCSTPDVSKMWYNFKGHIDSLVKTIEKLKEDIKILDPEIKLEIKLKF